MRQLSPEFQAVPKLLYCTSLPGPELTSGNGTQRFGRMWHKSQGWDSVPSGMVLPELLEMSLVLKTGTNHLVITIFLMLRSSTYVQDQSAAIILQTAARAHVRNQETRLSVIIMPPQYHHRERMLLLFSAH